MAITTIKGIVKKVGAIEPFGEYREKRRQDIIVFIPGTKDLTGQKMQRDETWCVSLFNEHIKKHDIPATMEGKIVEMEVRLSSKSYDRRDRQEKGYSITATLRLLKVLDKIE